MMTPRILLFSSVCFLLASCDRPEVTVYPSPDDQNGTPAPTQMPAQTMGMNQDGLPPGHPPLANSSLPEGHPPLNPANAPMANQTLPQSAMNQAGNPKWTVPASWVEGRTSSMRRGSFTVPEGNLDISVTTFPGDVGGLEANINRWRGQIGLAPAQGDILMKDVSQLDNAATPTTLVTLDGPSQDLIAGILFHEGNSWFVKMSGDPGLVARERPAFLEFLRSIQF